METAHSLLVKSLFMLGLLFAAGMFAIYYFAGRHDGWFTFWWLLTFSGIPSGAAIIYQVIRAHVRDEPLYFANTVMLPFIAFFLCAIALGLVSAFTQSSS
jgi:cytochrome bd-type quinol oxidase subunit 2